MGKAESLVDVMTGFNGTLFCYGQTGSGKTYSKSLTIFMENKKLTLFPLSYDGQLEDGFRT